VTRYLYELNSEVFCSVLSFDVELKSGFGLARHGPCNNRRVVPGLEHRPDVPAQPDPFPIRAMLDLGSDGLSPRRLRPARPDTTRWSDIAADSTR
jgi:hypothetical protein